MRVSIAKRSALTLLLLSLVVLFLGTACGGNEETTGSGGAGDVEEAAGIGNFNDWDANNNEVLNQEEFNEGIQSNGLFEEWDADNNNVIAENEFNDMSTQV